MKSPRHLWRPYYSWSATLIFLSGCSAVSSSKTPSQIIVSPPSFELARMATGAKKTAVVQLTNSGTTSVRVAGVSTSCGCTTSQIERKVLKPGQSVALTTAFDSTGFLGQEEKIVSVAFDDDRADLEIPVRADIYSLLEVSPPEVNFGQTKLRQTKNVTVEIKRADGGFLPLPHFTPIQDLDLKMKRINDNRITLIFGLHAKDYAGPRSNLMRLQTGLKALPQITIPVKSTVSSRYQINPAQINFGVVRSSSQREVTISPLANEQLPQMTITKVPQGFSASLSKKGNRYIVTARNITGKEQKIVNESLVIHANASDESSIKIPLLAVFASE